MTRFLMLTLIVSALACQKPAEKIVAPPEPVTVEIALSLSIDPLQEGGLVFEAIARNTGDVTVWIRGTCDRVDMDFRCYDPSGVEVCLSNDPPPWLGCPMFIGPLPSGEATVGQHYFSGTIQQDGLMLPAPSGEYRLNASFNYSVPGETSSRQVSAERTFLWLSTRSNLPVRPLADSEP